MKRKVFTVMLLFTLILSAFCLAACGDQTGTPETTTAEAATTTENADVTEETTLYVQDSLGDMNFDGITLKVLYWEDRENQEYFSEGQNGSEINDAIFTRNARIEERMKLTLSFVGTPGDSGNASKFMTTVKNSVNGGADDAYDVISAHSRSIGLTAYNGLTRDLLQYSNVIDLSKPWWPKKLTETCTINGQIHFVSGDISTNNLYMMYTVFCNKDLLGQLKLDDPYKYVEDGTWTIDKLNEMIKDVYLDQDSDGNKSLDDRFGFISSILHCDSFLYGAGIIGIEQEGGELVLSNTYTGERCSNLIDKLITMTYTGKDAMIDAKYKNNYVNGNALFTVERADFAMIEAKDRTFTEMSILPVPKYNADQQDYLTAVGNPFSLYAIPVNSVNTEAAATFLECSASESYRTVTPMIFEISMKSKYANGGNDARCYDLIRQGVVYDLSRVFWKVFSTAPDTLYQNTLTAGNNNWASTITQNTRALNSTINNIKKAFK